MRHLIKHYRDQSNQVATPVASSVYPAVGWRLSSGLPLTITGSQFTAGSTVKVGGASATSVVVVNSTTITCNSPSISVDGSANDVVVTNSVGGSGTISGGYRAVSSAFWMKQGLGASLDGSSKVQTLTDQSGLGNTVAQATPASRPALAAAYRNGKTAFDFTGGTSLNNTATSLVSAGGAYTLLYCGNGGGSAGTLFTLRGSSVALRNFLFQRAGGQWYVFGDSLGGLVHATVPDANMTADHYSSYHAPDRVGADMSYFNAGTLRALTVDTALATESGSTGFILELSETGSALSSKLLELVFIPRAITTAERQAWEAYCRTEYSLT